MLFERIREDIQAVKDHDPAARGFWEVFFLYPGVKAVRMHRRAHWFYLHKMKFIARWISQRCARKTGIEIHPGATIGNNVMISAGAKVLGPFKVGDRARIAAGAVVLHEVPADSTVVGVPARVVRLAGKRVVKELDQVHIPDPVAQEIDKLRNEIKALKKQIEEK